MYNLGITIEELSKSRTMIQGFNVGGQHAIGVIRAKLVINNLSAFSMFYVIDVKTFYKPLLGWA